MSSPQLAGCQGWYAAESLLKNQPKRVHALYLQSGKSSATERQQELESLAQQHAITVRHVDANELTQLAGNAHHQGVYVSYQPVQMGHGELVKAIEKRVVERQPVLLLVLDGVQDPHNLGACMRTAWAAGAMAVVGPKDGACGLTPSVHKVASGAAACLPYVSVTNLATFLREIKALGVWLYGADEGAEASLYQLDASGPMALVMGAEGSGLRQLTRKQCDQLFHIPTQPDFSTLNVSVATGVALFEVMRQRLLV